MRSARLVGLSIFAAILSFGQVSSIPGGGSGSGGASGQYSAPSAAYTAGTYYFPAGGGLAANATRTNVVTPQGASGAISKFAVQFPAGTGSGQAIFTWYNGTTNQSVTCTAAASSNGCSDATDTFTYAAGDLLSIQMVVSVATITSPVTMSWGTGQVGPAGAAGAAGATGATGAAGAAGPGYTATSTTSLTIGTGTTGNITTQAGLAYTVGARVRLTDSANTANYEEGLVTSYSGTTLVVNIDTTGGSGMIATWNINLAGNVGITGTLASNVEFSTNQTINTATDCPSAIKTFTGTSALTVTFVAPVPGCSVVIQNNTTQTLTENISTNSVTANGQSSNLTIPACATPSSGCYAMRWSANGSTSWDVSITQGGAAGSNGSNGTNGNNGTNGTNGSSNVISSIPNDTGTGTTNGKLAKINSSGNLVIATTGDVSIPVFGVISGGGTSGNPTVAVAGVVTLTIEAAGGVTAGHFVVASSTTAATLHDAGATAPTSGWVIGIAQATASASATVQIALTPGYNAVAGGASGVSSFTGDGVFLNNSASTGAVTDTLATQSANCFLSGPASGSAATPTCRAMVTADLPVGTRYVTAAPTIGSSDTKNCTAVNTTFSAFATTISLPIFTQTAGATWELQLSMLMTSGGTNRQVAFEIEEGSTVIYTSSATASLGVASTNTSQTFIFDFYAPVIGSSGTLNTSFTNVAALSTGGMENNTAPITYDTTAAHTLTLFMKCDSNATSASYTLSQGMMTKLY